MISIPKQISKVPKWLWFVIFTELALGVILLLYFVYSPFREWWGRYLPSDIHFVIFIFLFIFIMILVITGLFSGFKKKRQLLNINLHRLGIKLTEKSSKYTLSGEAYFAEFHGKKIAYIFNSGGNDSTVELVLYHQRPLNLGWIFGKNNRNWLGQILAIKNWIATGIISKSIEIPTQLIARGFFCRATEKMIGKALLQNNKIITPLLELDDLLTLYKGKFTIDDESVIMTFPYKTLFDPSILETACRVSTAFTNSVMLPGTPSNMLRLQKKLATLVALVSLLNFILFLTIKIVYTIK
ncbi:MAG: hypothetical protein ACE14V_12485 [bacterium]